MKYNCKLYQPLHLLITIIKTGTPENASFNLLMGFYSFSIATQEVCSHVAYITKENKLRIFYSYSRKKGLSIYTFMYVLYMSIQDLLTFLDYKNILRSDHI